VPVPDFEASKSWVVEKPDFRVGHERDYGGLRLACGTTDRRYVLRRDPRRRFLDV
jgi:hypothetical protein